MSKMDKSQILNHAELEEMNALADKKKESSRFQKFKHSLDSDEEDEEAKAQKYNVLDPNDLEGQEDGTIDFDGDIKITPFNMKEELEEGYFDKEGTYIFQKESDVIKDQWLDDIDWIKVKATESTKRKQMYDSEDSNDLPSVNLKEHYTKMLELMKPGESVQKAICRLGGSKATNRNASNRWKKKKDAEVKDPVNDENYEKLQLLTSFANDIVQSGDLDIYQQTYEKLSFHINSKKSIDDDAATDMFGDDFDEVVDSDKPKPSENSSDNAEADTEVMWEFKWESSDDAKVYGPYPTSQMLQWVQDKYFDDGVLVRQIDKQDSQFYNSKRIDFELYL